MLKSLVIPHSENEYRPHLIRWYGVLSTLLLLLGLQILQNYQVSGSPQVLAYATNTTVSGLLAETNANRASSGLDNFTLSSSLNSAAQAKAEHMIDNNYWAHVAPDGTTPWDFINATGYGYLKAGENLAYGYATSAATVVGWMNSPTHRANILDSEYETVGFGIANGANFQGGENTVVVAMYADPSSSGGGSGSSGSSGSSGGGSGSSGSSGGSSNSGSGSSSGSSGGGSSSQPSTPTQPTENPAEPTVVEVEEPEEETVEELALSPASINYQVSSTRISNLEALVDGQAHWTLYAMVSVLGLMAFVYSYRHVLFVQNIVIKGEHLMHDHPLLEASIIYAVLWFTLSASFGVTL